MGAQDQQCSSEQHHKIAKCCCYFDSLGKTALRFYLVSPEVVTLRSLMLPLHPSWAHWGSEWACQETSHWAAITAPGAALEACSAPCSVTFITDSQFLHKLGVLMSLWDEKTCAQHRALRDE